METIGQAPTAVTGLYTMSKTVLKNSSQMSWERPHKVVWTLSSGRGTFRSKGQELIHIAVSSTAQLETGTTHS